MDRPCLARPAQSGGGELGAGGTGTLVACCCCSSFSSSSCCRTWVRHSGCWWLSGTRHRPGPGDRWDLYLLAPEELFLFLPPLLLLLLLLLLLAALFLTAKAFALLFLPLCPELHFSALLKLQ